MELALDENKSLAEYALKQIQELYHIEQIADARKLDAWGRCELRQRLAAPPPYLTPLENRWNRLTAKYHQEVVWDRLYLYLSSLAKNEELSERWKSENR
jgi:transposase